MIFRILVDGSQITISNPFTITYTFLNVTSNHTIQAEFMKIPDITPPTITYISGIDINVPSEVKTNKDTYTSPVSATSIIIALQIDNPYITINGISKKIDAQGSKPIIKNGRTLLPIRTLIESLGGSVEWNAKEQKITITLNGHSMVLTIGNTVALVDGSKVTLDVAPTIINGRTYLPLRFISENLGASVDWDETTKTVTIYYWP